MSRSRRSKRRAKTRRALENRATTELKSWSTDPTWLLGRAGTLETTTTLENPYEQSGWVYAAITNIAQAISGVELRLYTGDEEDPVELDSGPLYDVFSKPNEHWDSSDLKEAMVTHLLMGGNSLLVMDRENPRREPDEMWCFSHRWFEPVWGRIEGSQRQGILGWKLTNPGGEVVPLERWQVAHIHFLNPNRGFWGVGPLQVAMRAALGDVLAEEWNNAFFRNGATIGGVLSTDKDLMDNQWERIRAQVEDRHQGVQKAFRLLITEGGMKYAAMSPSHHEMGFEGLRKMSREQIGSIFRVPPSWMGIFEEVHKAAGESIDTLVWQKTLKPIMRKIEDSLRANLFLSLNDERTWARFDTSDVSCLQESEDARIERTTKLAPLGVPFDVLAQRFKLDIEPFPGSDIGYMPGGVYPVDSPIRTDPYGAYKTPDDKDPEKDDEEPAEPEKDKKPAKPKAKGFVFKHFHSKAILPGSTEHKAIRSSRRKALAPVVKKFRSALSGYLLGISQYVSSQLKGAASALDLAKDVPPELLDLLPEHDEELRRVAKRYYGQAALSIKPIIDYELAGVGINFAWSPADPKLGQFITQKAIRVTGVNETIKEQLRDTLFGAAARGASLLDLQADVEGLMKTTKNRALLIARTETAQVANGVAWKVHNDAGVKKKQWIATSDAVTRGSHLDMMALGAWPADQLYPNGLRYPGDELSSDASQVCNCRCNEIPVE